MKRKDVCTNVFVVEEAIVIDEADTADNDDDAKPTKVYQFAWQKDDEQEGEEAHARAISPSVSV